MVFRCGGSDQFHNKVSRSGLHALLGAVIPNL